MWLAQQMIDSIKKRPSAEAARVTGDGSAQGAGGYRELPAAGPWGIAWKAPNAAQAVVVATDSGSVCVGTVCSANDIAPGELLLFSAGGAEIRLKNSGEVVINGQVFPAKGVG
jgi:phage gp45-like